MSNFKFLALLFALLSIVFATEGDKLRIGVTKKVENCSRKTKNGDIVKVHYTGSLKDTGAVFDSSLNRGIPFEFKLGAGNVIKGWDQGLLGMCIGEQRKLTIPPELGYGSRGAGGVIPPDATLVFKTELVGIDGYEPEDHKDEL
ncbi:peptidylprolyl isomerase family protein [Saccharomycopsis crataegensis]|uniref:peptidylprolyl isomerase n=1 Tax=Saccharomycopsis crataegensis TaxID=43959 RepID=A0AAV5QWS5_9ASCO|nr:peptidylprolyl isomerase family protein [Saccharomycopsis crataegensis]